MLESSLLLKKNTNFMAIQELLGLRLPNFQGIVFIWSQTFSGTFKSALVLNWIELNWIEIIYFQIKGQRVYNQNISIYNTSKYIKIYTIYSL